MEEDLLQAVISVETAIQQSLESERKKAAKWLESVRVSLSRELETKKQHLAREYSDSLAAACSDCETRAGNRICETDRAAERLQNIQDSVLQEVVLEFLPAILPKQR
jgi:hypothetical protein